MTFEEWFNKEISNSRGYLKREPLTVSDLTASVEESTKEMLGGPVDVKRMLIDAYWAGYDAAFPDKPR